MWEYLIFIIIGIILFSLANITRKRGFDKLTIIRYIDKNKLNVDEVFTITTVVENKKKLPISYLNLRQIMPKNVILSGTLGGDDLYNFKIGKNQRIKRSVKASISKRGVYTFQDMEVSLGDMFGFAFDTKNFNNFNEILVYPKLMPIKSFQVKNMASFGDKVIRRWIDQDNLYIKGIRDYSGSDRMKDINWKVSSRMMKLMVNEFDSTSNKKMALVLNVQCGEPYWKYIKPNLIEKSLELIMAIARSSIKIGVDTGFYTNAMLAGISSNKFKGVQPSLKSFSFIGQMCARVGYDVRVDFKDYLQNSSIAFNRDTIYIIVTSFMDEGIKNQISTMKKSGLNVKIVSIGEDEGIYYE